MNVDKIFQMLARVGFHGAIGLIVVLAVVFGYVYGLVNLPDHDLTQQAATVLVAGVGSLITAAVFMLKGGTD
jgi:hypothetical protein